MIHLPGYELIERIHESRRTIVYRGMREIDRASVMLKFSSIPNPSILEQKRFRREYDLGLLFMDCEQVITYYSLETCSAGLVLIEEDFGGISLERLIPSAGLGLQAFLDLAIQLGQGLGQIHRAEIIHKDIKPSNLVMNPKTGHVKYIDFGISSRLAREYQAVEVPDRLEGTLAYISPEQTGRMNRALDFRTDFYSLGATLYHLITGRTPFVGEDALELVHCHLAREPVPVHLVKPNVPEVISAIIGKLMAKDVEARYQSVLGLIADLERCRVWLGADKPIEWFNPGEEDVREHFFLSQRLYGREQELESLLQSFQEVVGGKMQTLLVSGYAGIGKSSLIRELYQPATATRAYFLSGKFDSLNRGVPYSAISDAFRSLIQRIMSEPDEVVRSWRERLFTAFGSNASVLVEVLPELGMLLGECPEIEPLEPLESRNRLFRVFLGCLEVLAKKHHPLILFLDDMQWADPASLELIELLIRGGRPHHFLLICAFRDNEVDEHHLLEITLNNLARNGIHVPMLRLGPMETSHLAQLIADSLGCAHNDALPLARVIRAKTDGNPFFSCQWLKELHQQRYLFLNPETRQWEWDSAKIQGLDVSPNVVDFLVTSMKELPETTVDVLRAASCLGTRFELNQLAQICEQEQSETAHQLWPALTKGFVVPLSRNYRFLDEEADAQNFPELDVPYRFQHDRVQQAAYGLLSTERARLLHLKIGRQLLHAHMDGSNTKATDVLSHLNLARTLIVDKEELLALARLNLDAGCRALSSVAYRMARTYLDTAYECLDSEDWQTHYELIYEIQYYRTQAAYFGGDALAVERLCDELLEQVKTPIEKARILEVRMAQCTTRGDMLGAIHWGLKGLSWLGISLDPKVSRFRVEWSFLKVRRMLAARRQDSLADDALLTDERVRSALNLLMRISLPCYLTANLRLYSLVCLERMRLSLIYGVSPEASAAFATYALFLGAMRGNHSDAEAIGRVALRLDERFRYLPLRCKVFFIYGLVVYPWNHHWKGISAYLKEVVASGQQSGDFLFASMAASQVHQWDPTLDLEIACSESRKYLLMIREMGNLEMEFQARIFQQMRMALMGRTRNRTSLNDHRFEEESLMADEFQGTTMITTYHVIKLQLAYLYDEHESAESHAAIAQLTLGTVMGMPISIEFVFFRFLNEVARAQSGTVEPSGKLKTMYQKMCTWARHCPANFEHRRLLMAAEMAALRGKETVALDLFQLAQERAHEQGYQVHEALAVERCGVFLLRRGRGRLAGVCFREAADLYGRWGALAKVGHLRNIYPDHFPKREERLRDTRETTSAHQVTITSMSSERSEQSLDLKSVVKSSLAISQEIEYRSLVAKMMSIVIESAGARKGVLVRVAAGVCRVEAVANLEKEHEVIRAELLDECRDLSQRVVRFTIRTGQVVNMTCATDDHNFSRDPYILENRVKSVLCLPIRHKDEVKGVLYLENNLVEGAFTFDRVKLLELLVAQAAISLENARLLSDARKAEIEVRKLNDELALLNEQLEQKVRDRTSELQDVQKELLTKAHQSGMAEVATSVLHNVGNILNSVITSCQLIHGTVESSRVGGLLRANMMLRENMDKLAHFLSEDPKGLNLMKYYLSLDKPFERERELLLSNTSRLLEKVESIRNVILAQQSYATKGFQSEALSLAEVMDDALYMLAGSIERHKVVVHKNYGKVPNLFLSRTKLIHMFVNLAKNAVEAMEELPGEKRVLEIELKPGEGRLLMSFSDKGHGIEPRHLDHIFQHGFTTKLKGHGFGLHSVANTMTEMGGSISVKSEGLGLGAAFILEFPLGSTGGLTRTNPG